MSVLHHLVSPASAGLFRAAISESGYPIAIGWEYGRNVTRDFASSAGCTDESSLRTCLREKKAKDLVKAAGSSVNALKFMEITGWGPVVDGDDLPDHPVKLLREGESQKVPLLAGTNTDEGA